MHRGYNDGGSTEGWSHILGYNDFPLDRGCTAMAIVGLLVTGKEKWESKKRTTDSKSTQLMGIQEIIKEMCVGGS